MNIFNKLTLKTLGRNRTRTLVTIIGIILSVSMITAVTTFVSSLKSYVIKSIIAQKGEWHGKVFNIETAELENIKKNTEVHAAVSLQNIGYVLLSGSQNEYKPYLFIGGMSDGFKDMLPVDLISGKMPENPSEIIMPKHLKTNGGISYALGDVLSFDIGSRFSEAGELDQNVQYQMTEGAVTEKLLIKGSRSYTVVGFYERPDFEKYSAPGYTALTVDDGASGYSYDAYIQLTSPKDTYTFLESQFPKYNYTTNSSLMRFSGYSDDQSFNGVLYGLAAILIGIIMLGSISLIYNAFSISIGERTKQFGLLSSLGATKRQMIRSVLFEAGLLSIIGIPIGILAGITGIGITLELTTDLFSSFIRLEADTVLTLSVSRASIVVAAAIGFITVLISAYLPARRALKVSAIDAVKQVKDISIKAKDVRTSKLAYRLFNLEAMIANKNFKRNRRKYRSTVISLFLSVVLFISASSFCAYLTQSAGSLMSKPEYDIFYRFMPTQEGNHSMQEQYKELSEVEGVSRSAYVFETHQSIIIPVEQINEDYIDYCISTYGEEFLDIDSGKIEVNSMLYFIDDSTYNDYIKSNSLDTNIYMNASTPMAVVFDFIKMHNGEDGRYYTFSLLKTKTPDITLKKMLEISEDGVEEDGAINNIVTENVQLQVGTVGGSMPFCIDEYYSGVTMLYPESALPKILNVSSNSLSTRFTFQAKNHKAVYDRMVAVLEEKSLNTSYLYNYAESAESERAMIAVINIFSYGFIILISLIAAANVFNTISTNIGLRRREFAMLKSIGMTKKSFYKMMNYECLLYGLKGLVYGIPVSIGVTWLIYRAVVSGWETNFFVPWHSVVIAVGSVFAVVFATMLYSMSKIRQDNPIDALKNENL